MTTVISATEANQRFSEMLRRVQLGETFVVTARGRPVAQLGALAKAESATDRSASFREMVKEMRQQPLRTLNWTREDLYD